MKTKTFPASLDSLIDMMDWIEEQSLLTGFDPEAVNKIELASEEAIVNIIQHGYKNKSGDIEISIESLPRKQIEISIEDRAPAFNPLATERKIDRKASLEEREEGGLGILFIRESVDDVRYERKGDKNRLILLKKFH